MGRPEKLTDEMKDYLVRLKIDNPHLSAQELTVLLKEYLIEQMSNVVPNMSRDDVEQLVIDEQLSESAIIKFNTEVNSRLETKSELDQPWSVSSLAKYPIPPEALPYVLEAWVIWREASTEAVDMTPTIREAQWIGRLYCVTKNTSIEYLMEMTNYYVGAEKIAELRDIPYYSDPRIDLDFYLKTTNQEISIEQERKILRWSDEWYQLKKFTEEMLILGQSLSVPDENDTIDYYTGQDEEKTWRDRGIR
ncbi:hypothetical protein ACFLXY_08570 [Chloroflexota bacterium]